MTIRDKRVLFTQLLAFLLIRANQHGYQAALGAVQRNKAGNEMAGGHIYSLHLDGLAADVLLYRPSARGGWTYCRKTEDYEPLGLWWEAQHELCRWGGRFNDGNHFSITHRGMA